MSHHKNPFWSLAFIPTTHITLLSEMMFILVSFVSKFFSCEAWLHRLELSSSKQTDGGLNWRASVASETLTGVTQSKIGDVYLFICIYVWTYVCHFVL